MKRFCRAIPIFLFSLSLILSFFVMPIEAEAKAKDKVSYTYKTYTLKFNTFEQWSNAIKSAQRSAIGFSSVGWYNSSGQAVMKSNGMIADVSVLAYKTIKVTGQAGQNVGSKITHNLKLPSKVRFKMHKHSFQKSFFFTVTNLYSSMSCDCGYYDLYRWEVPWDAFDFSSARSARQSQNRVYTVTVSRDIHS